MNVMFKIVPWFIGFVFFVVILGWITMGVLAYKTIDAVGDKGLKGVAEQVWCGKADKCTLPEFTK